MSLPGNTHIQEAFCEVGKTQCNAHITRNWWLQYQARANHPIYKLPTHNVVVDCDKYKRTITADHLTV